MRYKALADDTFRWGVPFELLVDGSHGVDILLPGGEQLLDIRSLCDRFSERLDKPIDFIEARTLAAEGPIRTGPPMPKRFGTLCLRLRAR